MSAAAFPAATDLAEVAAFADVLVANCRAGERLICTHTLSGDRYSLEPSSWPVSGEVARAAIGDGRLVPETDGLLDAGSAQTWRAA